MKFNFANDWLKILYTFYMYYKLSSSSDWLKILYTFYMYCKLSSSSFFPFKHFQMFQLSLFLLSIDLLQFWLWDLCLFIAFFWKCSTQYLITLEIITLNYFQCICLKVILFFFLFLPNWGGYMPLAIFSLILPQLVVRFEDVEF